MGKFSIYSEPAFTVTYNFKQHSVCLLASIVRRVHFTRISFLHSYSNRRCSLIENASYSSSKRSLWPSHLRRPFSSFWLSTSRKGEALCGLPVSIGRGSIMMNRNVGSDQITIVDMRKNNAHSSFHSSIIMTMELGRFVWNRGTDSYTVVDLLRSSHTL